MSAAALSRFRMILWVLVAVAALVATAAFALKLVRDPNATGLGGGSYSLTDTSGQAVNSQTLFAGHPSLLFFGYTHCPDVCPTTMAEMVEWFSQLGPDAGNLKAYFVTVDPERDTQEIVANYVGWTEGKVTGVTGTTEEIGKLLTAWRAVAEKVPGDDDASYTVNHTASVYLVNAQGGFEGTIAYGENADVAVQKIRKLIAG